MALGIAPRPRRQRAVSALALAGVTLGALALAACRSAPDAVVATAHAAEAERAAAAGDFSRAAAAYDQAAEAARAAGEPIAELRALLGLASALGRLGDYTDAGVSLDRALALAAALDREDWIATVLAARGRVQLAIGEDEAAIESLEAARGGARASGLEALSAAIEVDLGTLEASRGRMDSAEEHFRSSSLHAAVSGDAGLEALALANLARLQQERSQDAAAQQTIELALAKARAAPVSRDRAYLLISLALTSQRLWPPRPGQDPELERRADSLLAEALAVATASGDAAAASYAWGYRAELDREAGRHGAALQKNGEALLEAGRTDAPELRYRWQWQRARLLESQGDREAAIVAYRRAIDAARGLRQRAPFGYQRAAFSFASDVAPLHRELVAMLIDHSQDASDPEEEQVLLREARAAVESTRAAELKDYFRDECVEEMQAVRRSVDLTITRSLVVYTILLPDRLELLVSLPGGGLARRTADVSEQALTEEVGRFRALLEKRTTRQYLRPAQSLYRVLIGPLESILADHEIETLIFVPDGPLRSVPMAALHDGERFLIERFATATTPGIELTDPEPIERRRVRALFAGLSQSVGGFPALEYVPEELADARELVGGEILLDDDFSISKLEARIEGEPYNLIHIATHGQFMEDPEESFLLTWDGRLKLNEFGAEVSRFRFRDESLDILVLSACETAVGSERATLGLAGMAVRAGARSVVGTLWLVNDAATAHLLSAFYRGLAGGEVSRAAALQGAQRELIESTGHAHPGYWSAFLLIGSWL